MSIKRLGVLILVIMLVLCGAISCKKSQETPPPTPQPPEPPEPPNPPKPQEQLIGKVYYHDTGPVSQYDIFMADLYIVPKTTQTNQEILPEKIIRLDASSKPVLHPGVTKFHHVEIQGHLHERIVVNSFCSVDISQYDFAIRNVENLTNSTSDDFAVNVNNLNWITFVSAPDGLATNRSNTEIYYMNVTDRVRHQLTPVNNQYSGNNWDPDWKTDDTIVWSHQNEIVEVNINQLHVTDVTIPQSNAQLYDPQYSPDGSRIMYNSREGRKKNCRFTNLISRQTSIVLPVAYYNLYSDDNATWVFSNSLVTGHIFIDNSGRIYTRNLDTDEFLIITNGQRDFRYVTPIQISGDTYFIFSDWTDESHISLWISNINGTVLRQLNQTGDEAVFRVMGLPVPQSRQHLQDIALTYVNRFYSHRD